MNKKVLTLVPAFGLAFVLLFAVSASPGHGYVSVSAAAFQPRYDGYQFTNHGLYVTNSNGTSDDWIAPVQLPHGARVTKVIFYYSDSDSGNDVRIRLYRSPFSMEAFDMADLESLGSSGGGSVETISINYADVDNAQYEYFFHLTIPTDLTGAYGVVIEYTYPASLPLILRNFREAVRRR